MTTFLMEFAKASITIAITYTWGKGFNQIPNHEY